MSDEDSSEKFQRRLPGSSCSRWNILQFCAHKVCSDDEIKFPNNESDSVPVRHNSSCVFLFHTKICTFFHRDAAVHE